MSGQHAWLNGDYSVPLESLCRHVGTKSNAGKICCRPGGHDKGHAYRAVEIKAYSHRDPRP